MEPGEGWVGCLRPEWGGARGSRRPCSTLALEGGYGHSGGRFRHKLGVYWGQADAIGDQP